MKKKQGFLMALVVLTGVLDGWARVPGELGETSKLILKEGWMIQSSAKIVEKGDLLSTSRYSPVNWYKAAVPTTVLNALIQNKVYSDPYFGMNLREIPGTGYPIGENFSNLPMPPDSPFKVSWWYRQEFQIPESYRDRNLWLHFDGINFRANIWLNGRQIADSRKVVGPFRFYEFNISNIGRPAAANVLAVEVLPPQSDDLGITWVDVNPCPPDKNMGIYRPVTITTSGPVTVRSPQVISTLDLPSLANAHLTVTAELKNATPHAVKGRLAGQIENIRFVQDVELEAQGSKLVEFTPDRFPQLNISHPRVWWPAHFGAQNLYRMAISFEADSQVSDRQEVQFGIRKVSSELSSQGHRIYKVNGQRILARGAGWWSDMLLRTSAERQEWEIRYFRDMNLNVLRMDGKFEDEHFLDLCDRYGLLLLPGWCCCDHWEKWESWKDEDYPIAVESLRDRLRWFRNHPSVLAWLNGDDNPPPHVC
jgi:exo-1,4-beta-D-glucosaminidase